MLNEGKIKSMTKAAVYESGAEGKNIEISSYYRADYLGLQMVKSGIAYAVSFAILCMIWGMGKVEELLLMLSRPDYLEAVLKTVIVLFIAGLVCYEIAVYVYYTEKYRRARKSVGVYHAYLKEIHKFYETQDFAEHVQQNTAGDGENTI